MKEISRLLIFSGALLMAAGLVLAAAGKIPGFGRLPGDFYFKRGNVSFYFPLATCLLASLILTVLLALFKKGNS